MKLKTDIELDNAKTKNKIDIERVKAEEERKTLELQLKVESTMMSNRNAERNALREPNA